MKNKAEIIRKSNAINEAHYSLSLVEYRILHMAFLQFSDTENIDPDLYVNKEIRIHASEYMRLFRTEKVAAYKALREASERLFHRYFSYEIMIDPKIGIMRYKSRWVTRIGYQDDSAVISLFLSYEVLALIGKLKNKYTYFDFHEIVDLSSIYSVRVYEMLMQWRKTKQTPQISIEEFRKRLGIEENEYKRIYDLKKNVLDLAIDQINKNTGVKVQYEQIKEGRYIVALKFKYKDKKPTKKLEQKTRDENTPDMFSSTKMTDKQRSFFALKLSKIDYLGGYSPIGGSYDQFVQQIEQELLDINKLEPAQAADYKKALKELGFTVKNEN